MRKKESSYLISVHVCQERESALEKTASQRSNVRHAQGDQLLLATHPLAPANFSVFNPQIRSKEKDCDHTER